METNHYKKIILELFLIFIIQTGFAEILIQDQTMFDNQNRSYGTVNFKALISGNETNYNCSLYLNNILNETKTINNNSIVQFSKTLTSGNYEYYFNCSRSGEYNLSDSKTFFVNKPFVANSVKTEYIYLNKETYLNLSALFNVNDSEKDEIQYSLISEGLENNLAINNEIMTALFSVKGNYTVKINAKEKNIIPTFEKNLTLNLIVDEPKGEISYNTSVLLNSDEKRKQGDRAYEYLKLKNTGTIPLTVILKTSTDSFEIDGSKEKTLTILPNEERNVEIRALIDYAYASGIVSLGTIAIDATNSEYNYSKTDSINVELFVPSLLKLSEMYLISYVANDEINLVSNSFNVERNTYKIKSSGDYLEVSPNDEVKVEVLLKATTLKFTSIFGKLRIDTNDVDIEVESEEDNLEIDKDKEDVLTFNFELPYRLKSEDEIPFKIEISGRDGTYRRKHTIYVEGYLIVKKETKSIYVEKISFTPEEIDCNYLTTYFNTVIYNTGSSEYTIIYELSNKELNIRLTDSCTLKEYSSSRRSSDYCDITLPVAFSKDTKAGTYRFEFRVYDNKNKILYGPVYKTVKINDCSSNIVETPKVEEKKNETIVIIKEPEEKQSETSEIPTIIVSEKSKEISESTVILYSILLVLSVSVIAMTFLLIKLILKP
ncbi:MAG: hypothetical protein QXS41_01240 [Candidatus Woesearchaeota archaeon]